MAIKNLKGGYIMSTYSVQGQGGNLSKNQREFFERVDFGAGFFSSEGRFGVINDKFCELIGYDSAELAQLTLQEIVHPDDLEEYHRQWGQLLLHKTNQVSMRKRYVHKKGHGVLINFIASLPCNEDGGVHRILVAVDEVMDKEIEKEVNIAGFADIVHDIRGEINNVVSTIALADIDGQEESTMSLLHSSSRRLHCLSADILNFCRCGSVVLQHAEFSLREMMQENIRSIRLMAEQKGLQISCQISEQIRETLVGDCHQLSRIIMNLLGNAIKFTETGSICFKADLLEENEKGQLGYQSILCSVVDTGLGISDEQQRHIFQRFTKGRNISEKSEEGFGIGLTICKNLIEKMNGQIWVKSSQKGSIFSFYLTLPY